MIKKRYVVIALGAVSVLLGSLLYNNIILAQPGGEYDPWLDFDEGGTVDVNDLSSLGQAYGSSGDPTKDVNVVNWPIQQEVHVWWMENITGLAVLDSGNYNASGFGRLHVLVRIIDLELTETANFAIYGLLYRADHLAYIGHPAYVYQFNSSTSQMKDITLDVPSEIFRFTIFAPSGTKCIAYLSFYLTWS